MKNVMLTIETFGNNPYSVIISIGAVHFDPTKRGDDAILSRFSVLIDPIMSAALGFRSDMEKMCWWLDPARAEAYAEWYGQMHFDPAGAFDGFKQWLWSLYEEGEVPLNERDGEPDPAAGFRIWSSSPASVNEVLRNGYKILKQEPPWREWNDKCFTTMRSLPGSDSLSPPIESPVNTLTTATQQAKWLCAIFRYNEFETELMK